MHEQPTHTLTLAGRAYNRAHAFEVKVAFGKKLIVLVRNTQKIVSNMFSRVLDFV